MPAALATPVVSVTVNVLLADKCAVGQKTAVSSA